MGAKQTKGQQQPQKGNDHDNDLKRKQNEAQNRKSQKYFQVEQLGASGIEKYNLYDCALQFDSNRHFRDELKRAKNDHLLAMSSTTKMMLQKGYQQRAESLDFLNLVTYGNLTDSEEDSADDLQSMNILKQLIKLDHPYRIVDVNDGNNWQALPNLENIRISLQLQQIARGEPVDSTIYLVYSQVKINLSNMEAIYLNRGEHQNGSESQYRLERSVYRQRSPDSQKYQDSCSFQLYPEQDDNDLNLGSPDINLDSVESEDYDEKPGAAPITQSYHHLGLNYDINTNSTTSSGIYNSPCTPMSGLDIIHQRQDRTIIERKIRKVRMKDLKSEQIWNTRDTANQDLLPSLSDIFDGLDMFLQEDIDFELKKQGLTQTDFQIDAEALKDSYQDALYAILNYLNLRDSMDNPLTQMQLYDTQSKVASLILYLYSMESPFQLYFNNPQLPMHGSHDRSHHYLGAFDVVLREIFQGNRKHKLEPKKYLLYKGARVSKSCVQGWHAQTQKSVNLPGYTSSTESLQHALMYAKKKQQGNCSNNNSQKQPDEALLEYQFAQQDEQPVLFVFFIDNCRYQPGFLFTSESHSAFPEENEFVFCQGQRVFVIGSEDIEVKVNSESGSTLLSDFAGQTITVFYLKAINYKQVIC